MKKKIIKSIGLFSIMAGSLTTMSCSHSSDKWAFNWNTGAKVSIDDFINDIKRDSGQFSKLTQLFIMIQLTYYTKKQIVKVTEMALLKKRTINSMMNLKILKKLTDMVEKRNELNL